MMKTCLTRVLAGLVVTSLALLGCSSGSSPSGAVSGGSTAPVSASGGTDEGGASGLTGGTLATGGTPASGGISRPGSPAQGGSATGGAMTSAGGRVATGGIATGGVASGGFAAGGVATGGSSTGGISTGASQTGGSVTGGSKTGGSKSGGNEAGGSEAGGSIAGGSKMDAGTTGGATTGGVAAADAGMGGRTTTDGPRGGSSGSTADVAVVTPATGGYPASAGTPTIYYASDSTVSYYASNPNNQEGLGQELQNFFTSDVTVVDDAIGGRSSKSFIDEGHLTAILNVIKPGDYLFIEWGINDRYTSDTTRYTDPATTFRTYLQQYIDGARGKNAIPVLVTPTPRLDNKNGVFNNDYVAYCAADAAVAASSNTPLIDLQTMALAYYTRIGLTAVQTTIVLVENGQPNVLHFQKQGAYEMARLVALGVQALNLPISKFVVQAKLDGG